MPETRKPFKWVLGTTYRALEVGRAAEVLLQFKTTGKMLAFSWGFRAWKKPVP
jgi:hypothetical protein